MKRCIYLLLIGCFIIASGIGDRVSAAQRPDIISYDAELLQDAITVHIAWQSDYPVVTAVVSAGEKREEMELDPYDDNIKDVHGYHGEASLLVKVDSSGFTNEEITYVVQIIDDVGKRSRRISGTLRIPAASDAGGETGDSLSDQYVSPSSGDSPGMIDKVIKVMERHDTPPVVSEIRVNSTSVNTVTFFGRAMDDKGLKEVRIWIVTASGSRMDEKVFSDLGTTWQGTTEALTLGRGDYTVVAQAIDSTGNRSREIRRKFSIGSGVMPDRIPPVTSTSPTGGTYATAQTVTLTCTDTGGSGCRGTYYTTDGTAPSTSSPVYSGPFTVSQTATVQFFSIDGTGNRETVKRAHYSITPPTPPTDRTPPVTTATPPGGTFSTAQSVTLSCTDTGSGCQATHYTTDGTAPSTTSPVYRGPFTVSQTSTVQFFSVDKSGNREGIRTADFTIAPPPEPPGAIPEGKCRIKITDGIAGHHGLKGAFFQKTVKLLIPDLYSRIVVTADSEGSRPWGADDWANITVTSPAGVVQRASLGKNDAWGKPIGEQYILSNVVKLQPGMNTIHVELWNEFAPPGNNQGSSAMWLVVQCPAGRVCENGQCAPAVQPPPPPPKDTSPPVTTASPHGGTYTAPQTVTLTCTDSDSGCRATYYTTDGTMPSTASPVYRGPFTVSQTSTVRFFSVDTAGNREDTHLVNYVIQTPPPKDTSPPVTTASPHGGTYTAPQSVTLACTDNDSGCRGTYYTTDGTMPSTASPVYRGPFTVSQTSTVRFFSVDTAGNREDTHLVSYVIQLPPPKDTTAPATKAAPNGRTFTNQLRVTLVCKDDTKGSGCDTTHYTTDGTVPSTASPVYQGPFTVSGTTTVRFFSIDREGNREQVRTEEYRLKEKDCTPRSVKLDVIKDIVLGCNEETRAVTLTAHATARDSDCPPLSYLWKIDEGPEFRNAATITMNFDAGTHIARVRACSDGKCITQWEWRQFRVKERTAEVQKVKIFSKTGNEQTQSKRYHGNEVTDLYVDYVDGRDKDQAGWKHSPFRITKDYQNTFTIWPGQRVILAGDSGGRYDWTVDNFLYFEIESGGKTRRFVWGGVNKVYYKRSMLIEKIPIDVRNPNADAHHKDRWAHPAGATDISPYFTPCVPATVRVSALDFGGVGHVSNIWMIIK